MGTYPDPDPYQPESSRRSTGSAAPSAGDDDPGIGAPGFEALPRGLREMRVLVLHNHDFGTEAGEDPPDRVDVVNAARDVAQALASRGHFVELMGADRTDIGGLVQRLQADPPDLVFNLCESLSGDAQHEVVVPALLDLLGIPYTGSGPLALGLALRKDRAKDLLRAADVPTPRALLLAAEPGPRELDRLHERGLEYPLILKPAHEDASIGISADSVVQDDGMLRAQLQRLRARYHQPVLCEEYIEGREIYASLLGNPPEVLSLHEIDFARLPAGLPRIVCYRAKWDKQSVEYRGTTPGPVAALSGVERQRIEQAARSAFLSLGLCDYGRCDIRLSEAGVPYVIDVNPNCDLSSGAGFSLAGRLRGLSFDQVIEKVAVAALLRSPHVRAQLSASERSTRPSNRYPARAAG